MTNERVGGFSDGVFAVIITLMVLQLQPPAHPTFGALLDEWPTALSYVVSYIFVAIGWVNHHFLLRFADESTPRLVVWNFLHMFSASLVPFATAWVASTRLAGVPVFVYAAVIVMLNVSYHLFAAEVLPRSSSGENRARRKAVLFRSALSLCLFSTAMLLSLAFPYVAFALVTSVLLTYAQPEIPKMMGR